MGGAWRTSQYRRCQGKGVQVQKLQPKYDRYFKTYSS
jgi:hypothetical protein